MTEPEEINKGKEEIYSILFQKKEIKDETPKLRTEEEKKVKIFQLQN